METTNNLPENNQERILMFDIKPDEQPTIEQNDNQTDDEKKRRKRERDKEWRRKQRAKLKESGQTTAQPETTTEQPVTEIRNDDEPELIEVIEEIKPDEGTTEAEQKTHKVYITGRMFLFMINLVAPSTFAFIWNLYNKEQKVRIDDLRLSPDELKDVEELADEVTKDVIGTLSPMTQLLMFLGIAYGSKLMFAPKFTPKPTSDE